MEKTDDFAFSSEEAKEISDYIYLDARRYDMNIKGDAE